MKAKEMSSIIKTQEKMHGLRTLGLNLSVVTGVVVLLTLLVSMTLAYLGHPGKFLAFYIGGGVSTVLFCASVICIIAECRQRPRRGLRAKDLCVG